LQQQNSEKNSDQDGEEAGRQRQIMVLAHLHRGCSVFKPMLARIGATISGSIR
jgi:hypothetical protein